MLHETTCPCGKGGEYATCCQPFVELGKLPPTAAALMRSRYSAFVLGNADYLLRSWHPSTAPEELRLQNTPHWCKLEILATDKGLENDDQGIVEFRASYFSDGKTATLHEISRFVKENGQWLYVDGDVQNSRHEAQKVGRNDPCPCGSARKFKKCCGRG